MRAPKLEARMRPVIRLWITGRWNLAFSPESVVYHVEDELNGHSALELGPIHKDCRRGANTQAAGKSNTLLFRCCVLFGNTGL